MPNDLEKLTLIMQQIRAELGPPEQEARTAPLSGGSEDIPLYEWGQILAFGTSGNGLPHLGQGWSYPEEAYIWSEGPIAGFTARVTPVHSLVLLSFHCAPFIGETLPAQRVRLAVDCGIQGEWTVAQPCDCHALLSLPDGVESLKLEFQFCDARSPLDMGLSADPRALGIALDRLSLHLFPTFSS